MQRCYNEGIPFLEAEKNEYPYGHEEVGACVIRKWNFPEGLATAVMHHHDLNMENTADTHMKNLAAVVSLADMFCHKLGIGLRTPDEDLDLASTKAAITLKIPEVQLESLLEAFKEAYEKDKSFFVT
jgi:HD-like signal output (HDOD) protein